MQKCLGPVATSGNKQQAHGMQAAAVQTEGLSGGIVAGHAGLSTVGVGGTSTCWELSLRQAGNVISNGGTC
jgi:hypothetical protein